jgi:maleamate amidohydrolase
MNPQYGETEVYARQGFGNDLGIVGRIGMLIVDLVNGFADPEKFGGGNIPLAIDQTRLVLAEARRRIWPIAHTRIVFAEDSSDANIFSAKVRSLLNLTEHSHESQIVQTLTPLPGELVVRKTVPSGFFGTGLAPWFASRGVQTLVICGAVTSGCVRASAVDAMCHGFRPIVLADCVGDRAIGPHLANLFDMSQRVADVMDWATLEAQLPLSEAGV